MRNLEKVCSNDCPFIDVCSQLQKFRKMNNRYQVCELDLLELESEEAVSDLEKEVVGICWEEMSFHQFTQGILDYSD